jgi:2-dehydropantoate 2-reductase
LKIVIIGPGAIGCLFASLLARSRQEVWLLDHRPERARLLSRQGLRVSGVSGEFEAHPRIVARAEEIGEADLVLVAVKTYDTEPACPSIKPLLGDETAVLTLQNGLGNLETIGRVLGEACVLGGVTEQGASLISPGQVRRAGEGETIIGEPDGSLSERLTRIVAAFQSAGLPTRMTTDLAAALWGKLVLSAGINPLGALARVRNGELVACPPLRSLLHQAVAEAAAVARERRIQLPYPDPVARVEEVCRLTAENLNSMLQDIIRRRRTEVEAINGAVLREGEAAGVRTPVNAVLAFLVTALEQTQGSRVGS